MPFDDTGIALLRAQQCQDVFQPGLAIEGADVHPLDPLPLIVFFHRPIG
jgi:hypothetical protein